MSDEIANTEVPSRRLPTPRRDGLKLMLAVTTLWGAILAYGIFTEGGHAVLFGAIATVFVWPIAVLCLVITHFILDWATRGRFRSEWFTWASALAAVVLLIMAYLDSRPIKHFCTQVMDPVPASLSELEVDKWTSFNDGYAWLFAFRVNPQDFERLREHLNLHRVHVDWTDHEVVLREGRDSIARQELSLLLVEGDMFDRWDIYKRPDQPEFFAADRVVLVTDSGHERVYLYFDHWRYPRFDRLETVATTQP